VVSIPSLQSETLELSLNEEMPEKPPIWMFNGSSKMNWKKAEIWKSTTTISEHSLIA
jgi:hypothetical protein